MFTAPFEIGYLVAASAVFSALALLTRATTRRVAGALCGVLVYTAISAPIDTLALREGWWSYPSCVKPPHPPLAVYIGQAWFFVGCVALVGWRVRRRYGLRGVAALAALVCVAGPTRDFSIAAVLPSVIRVGSLPGSLVADVGAWAVVVFVALTVPRIVSGPAIADRPRHTAPDQKPPGPSVMR